MQLPPSKMIIYGLSFTFMGIYILRLFNAKIKLTDEEAEKRKRMLKKRALLLRVSGISLLIIGLLELLAGLAQLIK